MRKHLSDAAATQDNDGQQRQRRYERKDKAPTKLAGHERYLPERVVAAHSHWVPATVLYREIAKRGYVGGMSQPRAFLRAFLRGLRSVKVAAASTGYPLGQAVH